MAVIAKIPGMREIKSGPDHPPLPPQEPDAFACCGNGCGEACVWSHYLRARKRYEAELLVWQARQPEPGK